MLELQSILVQNPACPVREIGEGLVIMAPEGTVTHSLESIGVFIWNHIDGQNSLQMVLDAIVAEYDVAADTAREDLLEFVNQMHKSGLVLTADG